MSYPNRDIGWRIRRDEAAAENRKLAGAGRQGETVEAPSHKAINRTCDSGQHDVANR